jgi:adenylyltransferase/sulfurtransferase
MIPQISVSELKERMDRGEKPYLLDIREPHERTIAKLDDDKHIPMNDIPARMAELDQSREMVVYCRSGGRSSSVCSYLRQQGFSKVINLSGGILAWADQIDPKIKKY